MGAKSSRVKVVKIGGTETAVHTPKTQQIASAPATPEASPGVGEEAEAFPMPGQPQDHEATVGEASPQRLSQQRQTHSGARTWTQPQGEAERPAAEEGNGAAEPTSGPASPGSPVVAAAGAEARAEAGAPAAAPAGGVDFGLPTEDVFKLAVEAFGSIASTLSSTKWDLRLQALKGVGTVLKSLGLGKAGAGQKPLKSALKRKGSELQLRDGAACFRAACLILNIALREKVLPVLFEAHELLRTALEHGAASVPEAEVAFVISTLLEHVMVKIGEMNIRLHDKACSTFIFCVGKAPRLSLQEALAKLSAHLAKSALRGQQRMRLHVGILDVVGQLMRRFPGRREGEGAAGDGSWSAEDLRPLVAGGGQVDPVLGARVQQAAANVAVTVYTSLGKRALDQVMAEQPAAFKELILQKIEEETGMLLGDGDDGEGVEDEGLPDDDAESIEGLDLCVTGVAIAAPMAAQRSQLAKTNCDEEDIMDEILEETGMVFQGQGLTVAAHQPKHTANALDEDLRRLGLMDVPCLA